MRTVRRFLWVPLILFLGIPALLTWRAVRQERLNHSLMAAIKKNNSSAVVSLLNQGADANAENPLDEPTGSFLSRFLGWIQGHNRKQPPRSTALTVALTWDPDVYDAHPQPILEGLSRQVRKVPVQQWNANNAIVKSLLEHCADANATHQDAARGYQAINDVEWTLDGETPLIQTIQEAPQAMLPFGMTAEEQREMQRCLRNVRLLVDHGANVNAVDSAGRTPLMCASFLDQEEIVKLLLERGAVVNTEDKDGTTALALALHTAQIPIIQLLASHGAGVNLHSRYGRTSFARAAVSGPKALAEQMLAEGADINSKDAQGDTALIKAVQGGDLSLVKWLLEQGADPNLTGRPDAGEAGNSVGQWALSRQTPLICAAAERWQSVQIPRLLLDKGADINARDAEGRTALMWAVFYSNEEVLPILLKRGANTRLTDIHGDTALRIARKQKVHGDGAAAWNILRHSGVTR